MRSVQKVSASLAVMIMVMGLSACSTVERLPGVNSIVGEDGYLRDRSGAYLEAETIPRTEIPPEMDTVAIDDLYVIPEAGDGDSYFRAPPRPREMEGRSERQVVIQSIGDDSWIVVGLSPSQTWPRITDYWGQNRVPMVNEDPSSGIMDTAWFVLEDYPDQQIKFRVMVEPGFQDNSAEIRLVNLAVDPEREDKNSIPMPESSSIPEVEEDFLRDMSGYMADVSDVYQASTVSLRAGNIPSDGKASLQTRESGREVMNLQAGYPRSWAAVGLALDRAGIEIVERDRDSGTYDVVYVPEADEEPGFFSRLFSGGQEEYSMRVHVMPEGASRNASPEAAEAAEAVDVEVEALEPVNVEDDEEDPASSLLRMLRSNIA